MSTMNYIHIRQELGHEKLTAIINAVLPLGVVASTFAPSFKSNSTISVLDCPVFAATMSAVVR